MTAGYLSLTDRDRDEMLAAIGVSSVDDLFAQIPRRSASPVTSTFRRRSPRSS